MADFSNTPSNGIHANTANASPLIGFGSQFEKLANESTEILNKVLGRAESNRLPACDFDVIAAFTELKRDRQIQILNDLRSFRDLASAIVRAPGASNARFEKDFFLRFLASAGLRAPSDDFLDRIQDGDLIEIYDINCTQIYRSWSLFNVCSYTLPELLVYSFDVLYERPSWILGRLMELVPQALSPALPIIDFQAAGVGEYTLRERLRGHSYTNAFRMKYCTGLLGLNSRQPEAFVSTGAARLIETGATKSGLAFI